MKMRRARQQLSKEQCEAVLQRQTSGVLALATPDGIPYAVPLSYTYDEGKILFHCAKQGYKRTLIEVNPRVSFCVIDQDEVVAEAFTTKYRSVIVFGHIRILEKADEKRAAIRQFADRFAPGQEAAREAEIARFWEQLMMWELTITGMSGKEAIECVRERREQQ